MVADFTSQMEKRTFTIPLLQIIQLRLIQMFTGQSYRRTILFLGTLQVLILYLVSEISQVMPDLVPLVFITERHQQFQCLRVVSQLGMEIQMLLAPLTSEGSSILLP